MRDLQFNFNNEVDTFSIVENDDQSITVPGPNGEVIAEYDNIKQFAEMYALARDVHPDNLKNWVLVENGDVVSFVLRAGTAGVNIGEIRQYVNDGMDRIRNSGAFHPLDIERANQALTAISDETDIVDVLVQADFRDIARELYDYLNSIGALTGEIVEEEVEPEDTRTDIEKYLDMVLETDKTLAFFANLVGAAATSTREEIVEAINNVPIPYTADLLSNIYEGAISQARDAGIGVCTREIAILVISQTVAVDESTRDKIIQVARMAGRASVNIPTYRVGRHHVKKTSGLVSLADIEVRDISLMNNTPVIVIFDEDVDAEIEAEMAADDDTQDNLTPDAADEDDYDEAEFDEMPFLRNNYDDEF